MKYIFVTGAPGSKWSSVVKNIYYSPSVDRSDYSEKRTYYKDAQLMHFGAYFDPGMEFGDWFDKLSEHSKEECESEFDRPFSGTGIRIIKSHVFAHSARFIKETWPECPLILIYRTNKECYDWWTQAGAFNIDYPNYKKYYQDLRTINTIIENQNNDILHAWNSDIGTLSSFDKTQILTRGTIVYNNRETTNFCGIAPPAGEYAQDYIAQGISVKII